MNYLTYVILNFNAAASEISFQMEQQMVLNNTSRQQCSVFPECFPLAKIINMNEKIIFRFFWKNMPFSK